MSDMSFMLWFLGDDRDLKSMQAVGVTVMHSRLKKSQDGDNTAVTVESASGQIVALYCSCMMLAR